MLHKSLPFLVLLAVGLPAAAVPVLSTATFSVTAGATSFSNASGTASTSRTKTRITNPPSNIVTDVAVDVQTAVATLPVNSVSRRIGGATGATSALAGLNALQTPVATRGSAFSGTYLGVQAGDYLTYNALATTVNLNALNTPTFTYFFSYQLVGSGITTVVPIVGLTTVAQSFQFAFPNTPGDYLVGFGVIRNNVDPGAPPNGFGSTRSYLSTLSVSGIQAFSTPEIDATAATAPIGIAMAMLLVARDRRRRKRLV